MNEIEPIKSNQADSPRIRPGNWSELVDRFIIDQDISSGSRETYRRSLRQFMAWIEKSTHTHALTREDILAYKRHLESTGLSALTVSGYLVVVRRFFEWAETLRLYPNIAKGIKGSKRAKGFRKDCLTVGQVRDLLDGMPSGNVQEKRDLALVNLLVRTGLRTIEVIRAELGDMRQEGGEAVLWIQGKGRDSKDELVLLTPDTLRPIKEYLAARGPVKEAEPLFASVSRRNRNHRMTTRSVRRIVKSSLGVAGLDSVRLTAHSLRHTAVTLALQAGATVQEAQTMARHASIDTTLIYAHNIQRIAQAPERKIDDLLRKDR